jgi:hypothetical protein
MAKEKTKMIGCLILVLLTGPVLVILLTLRKMRSDYTQQQAWRSKNLMQIQFKGKVITTKEIDRNRRHYVIACLQLDYSNLDSCYIFKPGISALRIKNNKGLMEIPAGTADRQIDYIEVNINNNGQEKFYKNKTLVDECTVSLTSDGLLEEDMTFCDEN